MPYLFNTPDDQQAMLQAIGAASIAELFDSIPAEVALQRPLEIGPALSELELTQHMQALAAKNESAESRVCFLGGGSYDHFIPAVVDHVAGRSEFYTSYTPYQAEVSQGNLQAMFEYQSLICQLTGLDVSNASLYDGGTAMVEAALMAAAVTRQNKVVVLGSVHPEYRQALATYVANIDVEVVTVDTPAGAAGVAEVAAAIDRETACVIVQHPNFFGCLEDVAGLSEVAHAAGALLIEVFDPLSLGLLKRPGDLGADIAVAEGQSLGNPMAFGGPYLGIMACREEFMRRMPGRIAGQAQDRRNRRCWVLTLQTREQHIRRAKATSNICTNQGLLALRASVYLACVGPQGLREAAELCLRKAHYAADMLGELERFRLAFDQPFFKEFVIRDTDAEIRSLVEAAGREGVLAGVPLGQWYPQLDDCLLIAVTEKRTRREIERLAALLGGSSLANSREGTTIHA